MQHSPRHPADHGASMFQPPRPATVTLPVVADVPDFGEAPHESARTFPDVHHLAPRPGQNLPARYTGPLVN